MMSRRWLLIYLSTLSAITSLGGCGARSEPGLRIAVATSYRLPALELAALFEKHTGEKASLSFASTGTLHAQIVQGAPFDVLLAADQISPQKLIDAGYGESSTLTSYAEGRLALWGKNWHHGADRGADGLTPQAFEAARHFAIANPALAPYGRAARETLSASGLLPHIQNKLVYGQSVAQSHALIGTGSAEVGLTALSMVVGEANAWRIPKALHEPILQDAVMLKRCARPELARAFLNLLASPEARAINERFGFEAPPNSERQRNGTLDATQ